MNKEISQRLENAGLVLPEPLNPVGLYKAISHSNGQLFVSGLGPIESGKPITGVVGEHLSIADAQHAARVTMLLILAALEHEYGLENIQCCTRLTVYVRATDTFSRHPEVADGASLVLRDVFGEALLPARSALGVHTLPFGIPVEIDSIFELKRPPSEA